jgi:three-Cys-motif partner protein
MAARRASGKGRQDGESKVTVHTFGGLWTEKKLKALEGYLGAYRRIFTGGRARFYNTIYVDGFAGTGERADAFREANVDSPYGGRDLFASKEEPKKNESDEPKRGSARVALELSSPFDSYLFVEKNGAHAAQLSEMITLEYPGLKNRCRVELGDANVVIQQWCATTDWETHRAVVFLDPYGMSVEWTTIERIAATKAIDLFILFPLGAGLNRMLTRGKRPPKEWADKITKILGTNAWEKIFYEELVQQGLFGEEVTKIIKTATFDSMKKFFLARLETVFDGVAPYAMALTNSTANPMYLLCFAGGNKRGAPIAVRIASHLLKA